MEFRRFWIITWTAARKIVRHHLLVSLISYHIGISGKTGRKRRGRSGKRHQNQQCTKSKGCYTRVCHRSSILRQFPASSWPQQAKTSWDFSEYPAKSAQINLQPKGPHNGFTKAGSQLSKAPARHLNHINILFFLVCEQTFPLIQRFKNRQGVSMVLTKLLW